MWQPLLLNMNNDVVKPYTLKTKIRDGVFSRIDKSVYSRNNPEENIFHRVVYCVVVELNIAAVFNFSGCHLNIFANTFIVVAGIDVQVIEVVVWKRFQAFPGKALPCLQKPAFPLFGKALFVPLFMGKPVLLEMGAPPEGSARVINGKVVDGVKFLGGPTPATALLKNRRRPPPLPPQCPL